MAAYRSTLPQARIPRMSFGLTYIVPELWCYKSRIFVHYARCVFGQLHMFNEDELIRRPLTTWIVSDSSDFKAHGRLSLQDLTHHTCHLNRLILYMWSRNLQCIANYYAIKIGIKLTSWSRLSNILGSLILYMYQAQLREYHRNAKLNHRH